MISDDSLGLMLGLFAFSASDPLFETSFLSVRNRGLFREQCRETLLACEDARYDDGAAGWVFAWPNAARNFLRSYAEAAPKSDVLALQTWVELGFNGSYTPDLRRFLWDSALHWARRHEEWKDATSPASGERAQRLLNDVWRMMRSDDHLDIIEDVRDSVRRFAADIAIVSKTQIGIYDDAIDPMFLVDFVRGHFLLLEAIRNAREDRPMMEALNRIPRAWLASDQIIHRQHPTALILEHPSIEDLLRPSEPR